MHFQYRLAKKLGMTRQRLITEMTCRELAEWIAYDQIDPFGEERADLRAGIIASTVVNMNIKKGSKRCKPGDCMPNFKKTKQQTPQEMQLAAKQWTGLMAAVKKGETNGR